MPEHYIGLISGTSMDGIDATVASFGTGDITLHATQEFSYPPALRDALQQSIRDPEHCNVDALGMLDRWVGECFRDAAIAVTEAAGLQASDVRAIGSHGQTVRHMPDAPRPYSLQIGDPATIATGTGIATIADFRRADIAVGGQGAPLTPPFHEWLFGSSGKNRVVLNIGGMANITILHDGDAPVTGFDTGPGNTLLDRWIQVNHNEAFDRDGVWAGSGEVKDELLARLLADDYFTTPPPKSTGFEKFNLEWLMVRDVTDFDPADVQATLCELTARTIAMAVTEHAGNTEEVLVCGGGAHNQTLLQCLRNNLPQARIAGTDEFGLHPDWVEAAAFAWLAMQNVHGRPGNLPSVTGASRKLVLGALHSP